MLAYNPVLRGGVATAYLMTGLLFGWATADGTENCPAVALAILPSSTICVTGDKAMSKTCVLCVISRGVRKATAATDISENAESLMP